MLVETAIGGMAVDRTIEGRERYTINVRYSRELRDDVGQTQARARPRGPGRRHGRRRAGDGGMPAMAERRPPAGRAAIAQIPLGQLVDIQHHQRPAAHQERKRRAHRLGLCGHGRPRHRRLRRPMPRKPCAEKIEKAGPAARRAIASNGPANTNTCCACKERLKVVIPITLALIFVLLYMNFKSIPETFIILLSIPFAMTGSIWLLWLMDYNLSIAVWVGIIALCRTGRPDRHGHDHLPRRSLPRLPEGRPDEDPARSLRGHHLRRGAARAARS